MSKYREKLTSIPHPRNSTKTVCLPVLGLEAFFRGEILHLDIVYTVSIETCFSVDRRFVNNLAIFLVIFIRRM